MAVIISSCTLSSPDEISVSLPPTTLAPVTTSSPVTTSAPEPEPDDPPNDPGDDATAATVVIAPSDDASSIVADAEAGTSFEFLPGVHRNFAVEPRDGMSFVGQPGSVLSGAVILDEPVATSTGWRYDGFEKTGDDIGSCIDGYDGCGYTQDLFFDDVMLWQVTDIDDLESGTWFWGDDGIHVFDDPANRRVELSVENYAFRSSANDVTIKGLIIEKYATPAQLGAVAAQQPGNGDRGQRWLMEDLDVSGVHGAGVRTGDATIVRRVHSHHNGQMGISVSGGTDVLIEDSELSFNNIAGFKWGWEAGGSKFTRTDGLVVRSTHAHHNTGPGLWTDIDNVNTLYEGNLVENNTGPGIFHEISYAATIRDNVVIGNGFGSDEWLWGAGILIAASSDVEVYHNEVRNNANAIAGIQQNRDDGPGREHPLANIDVYANTIEMGTGAMGVVEDINDDSVFTDRNIQFNENVYVGPTRRAYRWDGKRFDRNGWQELGFDVDGVWR